MKKLNYIFILIICLFTMVGCDAFGNSKKYTINFYVNDAVFETVSASPNIISMPDEPTVSGYEFDGWYFDTDYSTPFVLKNIDSFDTYDINVYAKFIKQYKLSFETNCNIDMNDIDIAKVNDKITCVRDGYVLIDWYYDEELTNKVIYPFTMSQDITIYAKWAESTSTVKYYVDSELIKTDYVEYGNSYSLYVPKKTGHTFNGWYTLGLEEFTNSNEILSSIDLYAKFTVNTYTITFDYNGGDEDINSIDIEYGDYIAYLPTPNKTGYEFTGWYYDNTLITEDIKYSYDKDIEVVANFRILYFDMMFYDEDGSQMVDKTQRVPYGTEIKDVIFPDPEEKIGYDAYWLINNEFIIDYDCFVELSLEFYLNYSPKSFIITYDYGDYTQRKSISYNATISLPAASKYGYVFDGWYYNETLITSGTKFTYLTNITLTARYSLDTFTITFYDVDDNVFTTKDVEYLSTLTDVPNTPDMVGHTGRWCENVSGNYVDADFSEVTKDMFIYACYTPNTYTAKFIVFNQEFDSVEQTYNSSIVLSEYIPSVANYIFVGWYYNENEVTEDSIYQYPYDIEITARMVNSILTAPTLMYDESNSILTWNAIDNAVKYDLYLNGELLESLNNTITSYDISDYNVGIFEFSLYAMGNSVFGDSNASNVVRVCKETTETSISRSTKLSYNTINASLNEEMNASTCTLTWSEDNDAMYYVVCVVDNDSTYYYKTTNTTICFYDLISLTDISAIRVGAVYSGSDVVHMSDELYYYNPIKLDNFENQVYIFDGNISDYYITSFDELSNVLYYAFVYRISELDFVFDTVYLNEIKSNYGESALQAILTDINNALDEFYETSYCYISSGAEFDGTNYIGTINYDFCGVTECDINTPMYTYTEQLKYDAYYEVYNGTKRDESYNNFVSDNKYLYTYVSTSEELYWAVENGYTPKFNDEDSMAYIIYNLAKGVLNDIIYEEMRDYEKALAIFDWISLNTVYNRTAQSIYDSYGYSVYTIQPSYYLEGVFINGYAVCDGFSKAFSLMCNMEGIECIRIVGTAYTGGGYGGHGWNKVIIDDEAYFVDITWTDWENVQYNYNYGQYVYTESFSHKYFMISDEAVANTHYPLETREKFFLDRYNASGNYLTYFDNTIYSHNSNDYDMLISSDAEMIAMFDYVVENSRETIEILIDYNYIKLLAGGDVTVSGSDTSISIDTFFDSYLSLKMKECKFATLYITLLNDNGFFTYGSGVNEYGLIYLCEFYMKIDEISDIETLFMDRNGTDSNYILLISMSLLIDGGYVYLNGNYMHPTSNYTNVNKAIEAFILDNITDSTNISFNIVTDYFIDDICYITLSF